MAAVRSHTHGPARTASSGAAAAPEASPVPDIVEDRREDASGRVVVRRYVRGRFLGKGGFAKCYKFTCIDKDNKVVAGKVVDKSTLAKSKAKQKLLAEINIHRSVSHRHIVGFDTVFEDRANVYIMLEICPNQTMMELVKARQRLTEHEARYYALQIVDAMRYLHANNIIHRDLKLGNLLLSADLEIKVGDFGLATQLNHYTERKRTICGTPNYIAPEILDNRFGHSFEVDIWAFGVILYTMLVGKPPFETSDVKTTYKRIRDNIYAFPEHVTISSSAKDLIRGILQTDPAARPSLEQIARHPFMSGAGAGLPRYMPLTSLQGPPAFASSDLIASSALVDDMLAREIGGLLVKRSSRTHAGDPPSKSAPVSFADMPAPSAIVTGTLETVQDNTQETEGSSAPRSVGGFPMPSSTTNSVEDRDSPTSSTSSSLHSAAGLRLPTSLSSRSSAITEKENAMPHAVTAGKAMLAATDAHEPAHARRIPHARMQTSSPAPPAVPLVRSTSAPTMHTESATELRKGPGISVGTGARRVPVHNAAENAVVKSRHSGPQQLVVSTEDAAPRPARRALGALVGDSSARVEPTARDFATDAPMSSRPGLIVPYEDEMRGATSAKDVPSSTGSSVPGSRSTELASSGGEAPRAASTSAPVSLEAWLPPAVATAFGADIPAEARLTLAPGPSVPARVPEATLPARGPVGSVPMPLRTTTSHTSAVPSATVAAARAHGSPAGPRPDAHASPSERRADPRLDDTLAAIHNRLATPSSVKGSHAMLSQVEHALAAVRLNCSLTDDADMDALPGHSDAADGVGARSPPPHVWVSVWVDYTAKYGLGYLLSNGCIGVYFNDSTKMVLSSDGEHFQYIERQSHGRAPPAPALSTQAVVLRGEDDMYRVCATIHSHPPELKKKVTLLRHFTSYLHEQYAKRRELTSSGRAPVIPVLDGDAEAGSAALPGAKPGSAAYATNGSAASCGMTLLLADGEDAAMSAGCSEDVFPFVKKWIRTKRSVLFRLSNRCVQIAFLDGTSVLLWNSGKAATYTDRNGRRTHVSPAVVLRSHEASVADVGVRLRYVRDVIGQLVTQPTSAAPCATAAAVPPPVPSAPLRAASAPALQYVENAAGAADARQLLRGAAPRGL